MDHSPSPEGSSDESPEQAVEMHGPAESVEVKHEGGEHTVTAKHADGHMHHSKHASAQEAHMAASTLTGDTQQMPDNPAAGLM